MIFSILMKIYRIPQKKAMKLVLNLYLYLTLFFLLTFFEKSFSLTNYEITRICKKEKRASTCIKNLRDKRDNLEKGNLIKIPVIPYKNN